MKVKIYSVVGLFFIVSCASVQPIIYSYDSEVQIAIAEGVVNTISLDTERDNTNAFAIFFGDIETDIVLNSKARSPDAIKSLIDKTNRYINLGDTLRVPILFMTDISSEDAKSNGLPHLPYNGYTIYLDRSNKFKESRIQY